MRILHLIPTLEIGGSQRQLSLLAEAQVRRGDEVHVGLMRGGPNRSRLDGVPVHWHDLPHSGHHDPMLLLGIAAVVRRTRPDVIHTWLTQMDILGGIVARMFGRPWVLSERSEALAYPPTVKNRVRVRLAEWASVIVANSGGGQEYWRRFPAVRCPSVLVPNVVPIEAIDAAPRARAAAGASGTAPLVLSAGRFVDYKNMPLLVAALPEVVARTGARVMLCGDGPEMAHVAALVADAGVGDHVELPGFRTDVVGLMKAASVFVSLSRFEGQPNTVLEAMACRCPLVLSDIPGHRAVANGAALLVRSESRAEVAEAIVDVLVRPDAAAARALEARRMVEPLRPEAIADRLDQVYREVVRANGRASRGRPGSRPETGVAAGEAARR
jgi:glycosyltransferase involved in cell wall biosynthesis